MLREVRQVAYADTSGTIPTYAKSSNSPALAPAKNARSFLRVVRTTTSGLSLSRSKMSLPCSATSTQLPVSAEKDDLRQ